MKKITFLLTLGLIVILLAGCYEESQPTITNNKGGEYFYLEYDRSIKGNGIDVACLLKDGGGRTLYTFQCKPKEIRLEDANNDSIIDLFYLVYDRNVESDGWNSGLLLQLALGKSDGSFSEASVITTLRYNPEKIELKDINNDGSMDLSYLICDRNVKGDGINIGYSLQLLLGNGDGNFSEANTIETFQYNPKEVRLEDSNNDGIIDLLCLVCDQSVVGEGWNHGYSLRLALGNGDGSFSKSTILKTFKSINSIN